MKKIREPRIIIALILSLTLLSAVVDKNFYPSVESLLKKGKPVNVLLLGIDARPGENIARSDAIILVSIYPEYRRLVLLSIPRDTRIILRRQARKINMITQLYGPETTCREVSRFLGTDVRYYVLTDFKGFEKVVDSLGGVYVDVDVEICWYSQNVFIKKGPQRLNGKEALVYARFRGGPDADIGRTQRQQRLLIALARTMRKKENLLKLPSVIADISQYVRTNLSLSDMIHLADAVRIIKEENIINQTLPGHHYWCPYSGASYWIADEEIAKSILYALYKGERFEVFTEIEY
ncbi:LCP family protein [Thermosyntropha sp.]|uniref:LCP family protein n=1 Tax=Thermosyntropha sp. TaxID=2740820 RepID=UPI0026013686|nr:LCP family protein [Thermosyntropha sp.]MBO8159898.1 LCP family protein [Thermosyntropha sp.]